MGFKTFIVKADRVLGKDVAEPVATTREAVPLAASETTMMSLSFFVCASFIILSGRFLVGDFIPAELHVVSKLPSNSLTTLLIDFKHSCHPIYHSLLWLWVNTFGGGVEAFLRLPNLGFLLVAAYLIYSVGRRILNSPGAGFLVLALVLFNPAVLNHFSQLYGYSLSILLATLATLGALFIVKGARLKGIVVFGLGAVLLPMVIPTVGWALNLTLVTFMAVYFAVRKKLLMNLVIVVFSALISLVGLVPGSLLSFDTGLPPALPDGLESTGQWILAVVAQVVLFILVCILVARQKDLPEDNDGADTDNEFRETLRVLLLISLVSSSLVLLFGTVRPESCLAFLVPCAFGAVGWFSSRAACVNKYFLLMLLGILLNFLLWVRGGEVLTAQQLQADEFSPNLVQAFPAGERAVSRTVKAVERMPGLPPNIRVFVDYRILTMFSWYWRQAGGNPELLDALGGDQELALEKEHYVYLPKIAVGFQEQQVLEVLQKQLDTPIMLQEIQRIGDLGIFRVVMSGVQPMPELNQPPVTPIQYQEAAR